MFSNFISQLDSTLSNLGTEQKSVTKSPTKALDIPSAGHVLPSVASQVLPGSTKANKPEVKQTGNSSSSSSAVRKNKNIAQVNSTRRRLVVPVNSQAKREAKVLVTEVSHVVRTIFDHSSEISKQVEFITASHDSTRRNVNIPIQYPRLDRLAHNLPSNLSICEEKGHKPLIELNSNLKECIRATNERMAASKIRMKTRQKQQQQETDELLSSLRRDIAEKLMTEQNQARSEHDEIMTNLLRKYQILGSGSTASNTTGVTGTESVDEADSSQAKLSSSSKKDQDPFVESSEGEAQSDSQVNSSEQVQQTTGPDLGQNSGAAETTPVAGVDKDKDNTTETEATPVFID